MNFLTKPDLCITCSCWVVMLFFFWWLAAFPLMIVNLNVLKCEFGMNLCFASNLCNWVQEKSSAEFERSCQSWSLAKVLFPLVSWFVVCFTNFEFFYRYIFLIVWLLILLNRRVNSWDSSWNTSCFSEDQ